MCVLYNEYNDKHERREHAMSIVEVIQTALESLWYEIWAKETEGGTAYYTIRCDVERGTNVPVEVECDWSLETARGTARRDARALWAI